MNILCYDYGGSSHHTLVELVKSGHTVYKSWTSRNQKNYEISLGIKHVDKTDSDMIGAYRPSNDELIKLTEDLILKYDIDVLKVDNPSHSSFLHEHFYKKVKYIGVSKEIYLLESNKLHSKSIAESVGINVPNILKHGKYFDDDYGTNVTFPCVEKPSNELLPATVFNNEYEFKAGIGVFPRDMNVDYFIEEFIDNALDIQVSYVMSAGEYFITDIFTTIGLCKNKGVFQNPWILGTEFHSLESRADLLVREEAHKYLKEIAKLGGHWEGSLGGAYRDDHQYYFFENNVRPDILASSNNFMTGDEYLKGIFEDISLFENAWANKNMQKISVSNENRREPYPIHLHDKYNVTYPANLNLHDDGNYYAWILGDIRPVIDLQTPGVRAVGTLICDHNIPSDFIKELEETTWHIGTKEFVF